MCMLSVDLKTDSRVLLRTFYTYSEDRIAGAGRHSVSGVEVVDADLALDVVHESASARVSFDLD